MVLPQHGRISDFLGSPPGSRCGQGAQASPEQSLSGQSSTGFSRKVRVAASVAIVIVISMIAASIILCFIPGAPLVGVGVAFTAVLLKGVVSGAAAGSVAVSSKALSLTALATSACCLPFMITGGAIAKELCTDTSRFEDTREQVILEGRMKQTKIGQGIDYRMLSSCFALTAKLKDGTLLGAHFGHYGDQRKIDGDDGVVPGEKLGDRGLAPDVLFETFRSKVAEQAQAGNSVTELNLHGNLQAWHTEYLGLSGRQSVLSEPGAAQDIANTMSVPPSNVRVYDSSSEDYIRLNFAADGSVSVITSTQEMGKQK